MSLVLNYNFSNDAFFSDGNLIWIYFSVEVNVKNCQIFHTSVFITDTVKRSFSSPDGAVEEKHPDMWSQGTPLGRLARGDVGDGMHAFQ